MLEDAAEECISTQLLALIDLFSAELRGVKFPDVDADALALSAADVRTRARELALAEGGLATARRALLEAQEALAIKAQRATSYARIYAEDDPALLHKIEALGLARVTRPSRQEAEPRRRARKSTTAPTLFVDAAGDGLVLGSAL